MLLLLHTIIPFLLHGCFCFLALLSLHPLTFMFLHLFSLFFIVQTRVHMSPTPSTSVHLSPTFL